MRTPVPSAPLDELARLIARRTGLAGFTLSRENLERAAKRARVHTSPECGTELEHSLSEGLARWDTLIDELTVRETYFFRHSDQFELLRGQALPELRALLRAQAVLRVWSAGCASGEEAYSLAMLFADENLLERIDIIATDISRAAIERGRAARYHDWSFRSLDAGIAERHFRREGRVRVVAEPIRQRVRFKQLNLAHATYPALGSEICGFALIFCRNVLMFLDAETIAAIAARLHASLLPGGWLFTGPSDPNLAQYVDFDVLVTSAGLVYRRPLHDHPSLQPPRVSLLPPAAAEPVLQSSRPPIELASSALQAHASLVPASGEINELSRGVREAWNTQGAQAALALCTRALERCSGQLELHHLEALLLWELERHQEAALAMWRVLYLDRGNAIAHFGLGSLLERMGELKAARRSYHNVLSCCDKLAPDLPLPLGDGIHASGLRGAAQRSLARLEELEGTGA